MKRAILVVWFGALCSAQTIVNGGRDYKGTLKASGSVSAVDFSAAGGTAPVKAGTSGSRPTACTQGQIYFATDATAGQNLFFCTVTGAPGVWTQMTGGTGTTATGAGAPSGNCSPPMLYIDTTNRNLWFCGATNSWRTPTTDISGLGSLTGANTWTGYNNLSGGQWRPPESTVANLPAAGANAGKVFMVTDAASAGSCSTGGGSVRELCRANGSNYECVGGCGSAGSGGNSANAYMSPLLVGPDTTRTIAGTTHRFATAALLVAAYDNASPRNAIAVSWTVDPSTYDVAITFASPQSNYYVVINGAVGATGAPGSGVITHSIIIPVADSPIVTGTGSVGIPATANFACTINKAQISGDVSGSITVDIWKAAGVVPSSGNKISGSAPVTLAAAQLNQNSALTGWATAVNAGDVFWANVATVDGVLTSVGITLTCQ